MRYSPLERFQAFFKGEPIDRPMNHVLCMSLTCAKTSTSYRDFAGDGKTLARTQLQVAKAYGIEILSVCSDPMREAADLGAPLLWLTDQPPHADPRSPLLTRLEHLECLVVPDPQAPGRMQDRLVAIRELRRLAGDEYPILGWVEGPLSMLVSLRGLNDVMEDLLDDPEYVQIAFEFCVQVASKFAEAQIEAGAHMIGIGDAAASLIGPTLYRDLVLPYEAKLISEIQAQGATVRLHICGNTTPLLADLARTGTNMIDFDAYVNLADARRALPESTAILGNLEPIRDVMQSNPDRIRSKLSACYEAVGARYVVGAGCEIPGATPDPNLRVFSEFAVSPS
jgi:MtaA/CmuA family methyltransferase